MTVLVIPDVHLKPWMFEKAEKYMEEGIADKAVCLMDLADDWKQMWNLDLYIKTYDAAIRFQKKFSDTLWCYGNHDLCYIWNQRETGYSPIAAQVVNEKIRVLREILPDDRQISYVHNIDNVLFCHGGVSEKFVEEYIDGNSRNDLGKVVEKINSFGFTEMWQDESPIWFRPQYSSEKLYGEGKILQVVGHTPVEKMSRSWPLVSCDVFCTSRERKPEGSMKFTVVDTETWSLSEW